MKFFPIKYYVVKSLSENFFSLTKFISTMTLNESCLKENFNNFILCDEDELNLGITLKGGQSFRFVKIHNIL